MNFENKKERIIINVPADGNYVEILGHKIEGFESFKEFLDYLNKCAALEEENELLKHRLEIANEYIESRHENMIPEHYDDLKYIINECDLESTW